MDKNKQKPHIAISDELRDYLLSQRDRSCKTLESVIWRFIKNESGEAENLKSCPPNNKNKWKGVNKNGL
jgi:hypothetical protein